jgi:hypothetical protein
MKVKSICCVIGLLMASAAFAAKPVLIPYCKGTQVSKEENAALQMIVPAFASDMGCAVGNNCLLSFNEQPNFRAVSIAWTKRCGPVINGVYQLGNQDGLGATFTCKKSVKEEVTCSPLGYEDYYRAVFNLKTGHASLLKPHQTLDESKISK